MNRFLYTVLLIVAVPFIAVWYVFQRLLKGNYKRGFWERLGVVNSSLELENRDVVWVHAASVGEVMASEPLITGLKQCLPTTSFVLTTNTDTGYSTAKDQIPALDAVYQTPLDLPMFVCMFLKRVKPSLLLIMETEIWPNMISITRKQGIPVCIANGRISDRAYQRYNRLNWFFSSVLQKVDLFIMQYQTDADKIVFMGANPDCVLVAGNIKYDRTHKLESEQESIQALNRLGWNDSRAIVVAGSTHAVEETYICEAFKIVMSVHPEMKLVLAPRHPDRIQDVCNTLKKHQMTYVLMTDLFKQSDKPVPVDVLVLNVMGQLLSFYSAGNIAFVGGSLQNIGGHNVLEPASLSKPVLFGPYTANFRDAVNRLITQRGGHCINTVQELADAIIELYENPEKACSMGNNAYSVVMENKGAVDRHIRHILQLLLLDINTISCEEVPH